MRKIRINNDILVDVSVKRDGYPEELAGKEVLLSMKVAYINIPVKDFTVNGNVISFTFPASSQKHRGMYSLTIQVKYEDVTNTVDKCDIFELVDCSCQISGEDDPNIKTESVSLGLDVYLDAGGSGTGGGGEGTSDYNNLENKPKINGVTLQGEKTLESLGIQPAGDYLTEHQDISNLVTVEELASGLAEKQPKGDYALASDIPSLAGYATEQWVTSQINNAIDGLSTEIVSINDLVGTDTEGGIA